MLTGKFLFTLLGISLAIFALCNTEITKPVVENWWGGTQFTTKAMPAAKINGQMVAMPGNNIINPQMMGNNSKFVSVPSFQGVLSPRFSNVNYGANIKYNLPDRKNLGSPCDPLTFGEMARENYRQGNQENYTQNGVQENYGVSIDNPPSCGKGGYGIGHQIDNGYGLTAGYSNGNYEDVYNSLPSQPVIEGDLPIGTMSTMDSSGNVEQFLSYARLMPSNTKSSSRLRAQSDYIRGDLAIVPCQSGWFSVYPDLSRDINEGAMNVMTEVAPNSSYADMIRMVNQASGGSQTSLGGANITELPNYAPIMSGSSTTGLSAAMGDIQVTSFP